MSAMPSIQSALSKVLTLEDQLNGAFIERREVIRSLLIALIAEENVLLLGPPGTAKSALARSLSNAMQSSFFEYLFTKFSTPEEIFGPVSIKKLQNDVYERVVSNKLPSAEIAFLDEIFKANSAILNSLLTLINEKEYDSGSGRISVPLQMVIGASNEYPQDQSLEALYDRFVIRHWVDDLTGQGLHDLLSGNTGNVTQQITIQDLDDLRSQRDSVDISGVISAMVNIYSCLTSEHQIRVSARTWMKLRKVIASNALLDGRSVADGSDLMALKDCLWSHHEDKNTIEQVLRENIFSKSQIEAQNLLAQSTELYNDLSKRDVNVTSNKYNNIKFWGDNRDSFIQIVNDLKKLDSSDPYVDQIISQVLDHKEWAMNKVEEATTLITRRG